MDGGLVVPVTKMGVTPNKVTGIFCKLKRNSSCVIILVSTLNKHERSPMEYDIIKLLHLEDYEPLIESIQVTKEENKLNCYISLHSTY